MKYNIELLKADILDEFKKLDFIDQEFQKVISKLKQTEAEISYYDRGAIGYLLHNFYNGCENIFKSIARFFENDIDAQSWHRNLLKRMNLEISGFRPKVIDEQLYRILDDFRGFRHKFRHSYAFELDWEKEKAVALKLPQAHGMLKSQLNEFMNKLNKIDPSD